MPPTLRLRIFAGPNGSGKSIMKQQVQRTEVRGQKVDLGKYVNADEIAKQLRERGSLNLASFGIRTDARAFKVFAEASGLLRGSLNKRKFDKGYGMEGATFQLLDDGLTEHFAQLIAAYLCDQLVAQKIKFSFETVFSHATRIMR